MARIYVDNGININPLWYGSIAVSPDGVNWETFYKGTLSVHPVLKGSGTTNPPGVLGESGALVQTRIYLRDFTGYRTIDFECDDVVNQPAWNGRTPAALQQAVDDITEWIGEISAPDGGLANQQEFMEVLIQDANGDLFFMVRTLDESTGVYTVTYINADGTAAVPVAPVTPYGGQSAGTHAEDTPHTTGDFGVQMLAVRNDAAAAVLSGTDGDYTPIAVDDNGRVFVYQDQAIAAGENHIGAVGGNTVWVSSTITMSVAGAYASGDYMGTTTTPQSFSGATRIATGSGIIKSLVISDKIATANVAMELWLFRATFTAPTDNDPWAISDTEMLDVIGIIPINATTNSTKPGWFTSSNNQIFIDDTLSIPFKLSSGSSIYYALVSRGVTPAFTSADLTINLGILQD